MLIFFAPSILVQESPPKSPSRGSNVRHRWTVIEIKASVTGGSDDYLGVTSICHVIRAGVVTQGKQRVRRTLRDMRGDEGVTVKGTEDVHSQTPSKRECPGRTGRRQF